jgi:hypothetical protein
VFSLVDGRIRAVVALDRPRDVMQARKVLAVPHEVTTAQLADDGVPAQEPVAGQEPNGGAGMTTLAEATQITVREPQLRIAESEALAALGRVLVEPGVQARARLRLGPVGVCEPLARVLDKALVRAQQSGLDADALVLSVGSAVAAENIVRVRRKAHGVADLISSAAPPVVEPPAAKPAPVGAARAGDGGRARGPRGALRRHRPRLRAPGPPRRGRRRDHHDDAHVGGVPADVGDGGPDPLGAGRDRHRVRRGVGVAAEPAPARHQSPGLERWSRHLLIGTGMLEVPTQRMSVPQEGVHDR